MATETAAKHSVKIAWGKPDDHFMRTYEFETEMEVAAFLAGIGESVCELFMKGVGGYTVMESDPPWVREDHIGRMQRVRELMRAEQN